MEIFNLSDSLPPENPDSSVRKSPSLAFPKQPKAHASSASPENRITALKPALRDKNRVNIFLDEKFAFSLDLAQVVDFKLKLGLVLSPERRRELESASEFGKLYASTLEWVFLRPRSRKETRDHLSEKLYKRQLENESRRKNRDRLSSDPDLKSRQRELKIKTKPLPLFSPEDIDKVIEKLSQKGYLDDRKFAEWYIENRNLKKGISRRQLELELTRKGIARPLLDELLATSPRSDEAEIKKIILKKAQKLPEDKLLRYLVSKGFPYDLSKSLLIEFRDGVL
ncbi:RecX family transcriptional regulator [Candidatus Saccharibacteria bacterium]|nr:RecX family transcriptional regulator [Candidatus Saccharibacteria bacterium]